MKTIFKTGLLMVLLQCVVSGAIAQQAYIYSQSNNNLSVLNPAYSLRTKASEFYMLGRRQWVGVDGAPTTYVANGNFNLPNIAASAGLAIVKDEISIEDLFDVNAYMAKSIRLSDEMYLGASLMAGVTSYIADYRSLDPEDPALPYMPRSTSLNVGFSTMLYSRYFYLGISSPRLRVRQLGTLEYPTSQNVRQNYYIIGGANLPVKEGIVVKPSLIITSTRNLPMYAYFSANVVLGSSIETGIGFSTNNEMSGLLSYIINKKLAVTYSYQFGISRSISSVFNSTHEIGIGYRFGNGSYVARPDDVF